MPAGFRVKSGYECSTGRNIPLVGYDTDKFCVCTCSHGIHVRSHDQGIIVITLAGLNTFAELSDELFLGFIHSTCPPQESCQTFSGVQSINVKVNIRTHVMRALSQLITGQRALMPTLSIVSGLAT